MALGGQPRAHVGSQAGFVSVFAVSSVRSAALGQSFFCLFHLYRWSSASASHCGSGHEAFVTRRLKGQGLADTEMEALDFPETHRVLIRVKEGP